VHLAIKQSTSIEVKNVKRKFIFDVDGTLTPSRQKIDDKFYTYFLNFCRNNLVYLVTGSDKPKTVEQVTPEIYNSCKTVYNCLGNDVWQGNENIYTSDWKLPEVVHEALSFLLGESEFPYRTGLHFDHRPGLCNFSVIGRNATLEQRAEYVEWDKKTYERIKIANAINDMFPNIEARIGGETGLDIIERGRDKAQIISQFADEDAKLFFFGDKMEQGGNDHSLSQVIKEKGGELFHVKDYKDTWDILKNVIK
jgi:phosphomannomutase